MGDVIDMTLADHLDELSEAELSLEMMALMEAVAFDYARFAEALHLNPDIEETETVYETVHTSYATFWKERGEGRSFLDPYVFRWKVRIA